MKKGKIKYVFPGNNTPRGFYSFYALGLEPMDRIFILKGGPGTGKSTLMRKIGLEIAERGYNVEFWHCSSDHHSLDGMVILELKTAVVDGTSPHVIDPKYPGAVDEIVNLGEHWDEKYLQAHKGEIKTLAQEIGATFSLAYQRLDSAKTVYDEWKNIHVAAMDFARADRKGEELMQEIFRVDAPLTRHLFAGAITPAGLVNFINNITEDCQTRYILKGLPGTGKSTLIKKITDGAVDRGYQADVYHCSLDPDSIDMAVIPRLGVAVIDGSIPHVADPERPGDRVVNMTDCLDLEAVERKADRVAELQGQFQRLLDEGISHLAQAKDLHDSLEVYYVKAMDFEAVDEVRNRIYHKILALADRGEK